jgi:methionine sulfoxide reductase heme-binding subunit
MQRAPAEPGQREAELEQAAPDLWQFALPAIALVLDVAVAASGAGPQTVWYVIRAAGVIAYILLALTVVCGLLISNRILPAGRIRVDIFETHSFMALLVLAFGGFHALALLVDNYVGFSVQQILIPFTSTYRPTSVALGILGFYGSAVIYASFWARKLIGYQAWRYLHYGSFLAFVAVTFHGVLSGADAGRTWMVGIYAVCVGAVAMLTFMRLLPDEN